MKKLFLVIGLKVGEIIGAIAAIIGLPMLTGHLLKAALGPRGHYIGGIGEQYFLGLTVIACIAGAVLILRELITDVIPEWITFNRRLAARIMGEEKVYCHACAKEAGDKKPVHHYRPVCKQKKKKGEK